MTIGVKIDRIVDKPDSSVKAFASVTFDGSFAVHGLRVMDSQKGRFVNMPSVSYQDKTGKTQYSETFHPITKQARDYIQMAVLKAYDTAIQQQQTVTNEFTPEQNPVPDMAPPYGMMQ